MNKEKLATFGKFALTVGVMMVTIIIIVNLHGFNFPLWYYFAGPTFINGIICLVAYSLYYAFTHTGVLAVAAIVCGMEFLVFSFIWELMEEGKDWRVEVDSNAKNAHDSNGEE